MFALSFGVFRINFTSILDGFLRTETRPDFIFGSFKNSLIIPTKILIPIQCSKTFADSHNRSKNERTFSPETF
jgi:hypothetical protein